MPGNPETQKEILKRLQNQGIPGYKIEGILGSGAMATVFRGKQTSLNRIVAIKVLRSRLAKNKNYVRRFHREGRSAAKLNHHNIVSAIDVGQAGKYHYFVMEYVEGDTIDAALKQGKVFEEKEALNVIIQVARALNHAHEHWIIHRDIKPRNIMITNEGVVKLADMGIARELNMMNDTYCKSRGTDKSFSESEEQTRAIWDELIRKEKLQYRRPNPSPGATPKG